MSQVGFPQEMLRMQVEMQDVHMGSTPVILGQQIGQKEKSAWDAGPAQAGRMQQRTLPNGVVLGEVEMAESL